jgi:hypothetical protein
MPSLIENTIQCSISLCMLDEASPSLFHATAPLLRFYFPFPCGEQALYICMLARVGTHDCGGHTVWRGALCIMRVCAQCMWLHVHMCTHACGGLRLIVGLISDSSSTLFSETGSLNQSQNYPTGLFSPASLIWGKPLVSAFWGWNYSRPAYSLAFTLVLGIEIQILGASA